MKRALIATVDAARARIFLYQEQAKPGFELIEYRDLDSPGRRLKAGELFSTTRPDSAQYGGPRRTANRRDAGEPGATYDDHRDAHIEDMDTKFAKHIIETIRHVLHDKQMSHLVLCAPPKMLGVLRGIGGLEHRELVVDELAQDVSHLSVTAIHDHLARLGHIPARTRLAAEAR